MVMAVTADTQEFVLSLAIQANVPTILWGEPGIGKTSVINQIGHALNLHVETVIVALREPPDIGGLPIVQRAYPEFDRGVIIKLLKERFTLTNEEVEGSFDLLLNLLGTPTINNGQVELAPPAWALRLKRLGKGIVFFDELSAATPRIQNSVMRIVTEHVVGDLPLPNEVRVIAAANRPDQITGGWDLSPPLANRFFHLEWKVNRQAWCHGLVYGWNRAQLKLLPENWREQTERARRDVAAFIMRRPELVHQRPKEETLAGMAWPSPRSWEKLCVPLHAACLALNLGSEERILAYKGSVGPGAGKEFLEYLKELNLPDPEDLLRNPAGLPPLRDDCLFAALLGVVTAVRSNNTPERWLAAWEVLGRAAKQNSVDVAVSHAYALKSLRPANAPAPESIGEFVKILQDATVI